MRNKSVRLVISLVLILLVSSCGYHFSGGGGHVPEDARAIAIPTFVNGTNEPYVDVEVTKAVVDEFLSDGRLQVAGPEASDLVLRGRVTRFSETALSYTADSHVQQYSISIGVDVSLEEAKTRKMLWQEKGLGSVFVSSYSVTIGDISTTKTAKEAALKKASKDIASTVRGRVLEGF